MSWSEHGRRILFCPIMMPKLDGFRLCRRLKADAATVRVPVVLLTALTHRDASIQGWEAGADEYLFKPFHPRELVTRVRSILTMSQARKRAEDELRTSREQVAALAHRRIQEALLQSEATNRTLLETAAQGILAIDVNGAIVLANRSVEEMFGYGRNELPGRPLEILLPLHLRERHRMHRAAFHAHPGSRAMGLGIDLWGRRKDDTNFPVEIGLSAIETASGRLAVAFVSDITQRKHLEHAARAHAQAVRTLAASLLTAQEEERRRVSRELHDQICQQLASLAIDISGLVVDPPPPVEAVRLLKDLQVRVVRVSEATRHIAYELHPSVLDDLGLVASLRALCKEFSEREHIAVEFHSGTLAGSVPREIASCLYRIAQESLRNIAKHSGSRQASVRLRLQKGVLVPTVWDQGAGFDVEAVKSRGGLGLIGMEERANLVKGKLSIAAKPGRGTRITMRVSVPGGSS